MIISAYQMTNKGLHFLFLLIAPSRLGDQLGLFNGKRWWEMNRGGYLTLNFECYILAYYPCKNEFFQQRILKMLKFQSRMNMDCDRDSLSAATAQEMKIFYQMSRSCEWFVEAKEKNKHLSVTFTQEYDWKTNNDVTCKQRWKNTPNK